MAQERTVFARLKQYSLLKAALGNTPDQALPGSVFLWGAASAGKFYTLEKVLEGTEIHQIIVHSAEILCGRRAFYESIVKQLVSNGGKSLESNFKCDSLRSLYSNFMTYYDENESIRNTHCVLIVKAAENFRGEYDDILNFFVCLQDTSQLPLCVVLISKLPPVHFMPNLTDNMIPIYFPQYSKEDLEQILIKQKRKPLTTTKSDTYYDLYVKLIVSVFYYVCRDIRKLQRLTRTYWEKFREMLEDSVDVNVAKLFKTLEPQLKSQFFEMNSSITTNMTTGGSRNLEENVRTGLSMPSNAKYLIIAAYLATHNPASSDKRFFVKSKAGKSNKGRKSRANGNASTETTPVAKTFEMNRLNAIFSTIQIYCDDKVINKNRNIVFMNLLSTLCQNKLIQSFGEDSLGNHKYKCLLDYDTVLDISRSVNFELNNYLYRFL